MTRALSIATLSGGVGGARFIRGLRHYLDENYPGSTITVIGNTGDDIAMWGLRICPDLDTVLYTLGGGIDERQGWGRDQDTRRVQSELAAYHVVPQWFGLGDLDIATHIARTLWLGQGATLSEVTSRLADRWGLPQQRITLLPMTDTPVQTHVVLDDDDAPTAMHFQQWWVEHQASLPAERFVIAGLDQATAAPGVIEAIEQADIVVLPPSNPVVSLGVILAVPGIRDALRATAAPVVGVSPIIAGSPVRGHADVCLATIGVPATAAAVAGLYVDFLDAWLVDPADAASAADPQLASITVQAWDQPLLMSDASATAAMAGATLQLAHPDRITVAT